MDLKNAAAVCLISLCSATLVVLIARSLDNQAAARIEPQLAGIVDELRALRKQGGVSTANGAASDVEASGNGLLVYYFHNNTRCPTCRSIESQAEETVKTHFPSQLNSGELTWKILNYDQPAVKPLVAKFDIQAPVVVLARMKDGQVGDWKRLDEVWALVGDKPEFTKFVRGEIERMLAPEKQPKSAAAQAQGPTILTPGADVAPAKETPAIPIP